MKHAIRWSRVSIVVLAMAATRVNQAVDLTDSQALTFDDGAGNTMPYRLFIPADLEPRQRYPLVLYLHGISRRGTDNLAQVNGIAHLISVTQSAPFKSYLVVPQERPERFWWEPSSISLVLGVLAEVKGQYEIDKGQVYVLGYSMGGIGLPWLVYSSPEEFAAAVPISGGVPPNRASEAAAVIKDVPLWAFHGALDGTVPVEFSRALVEAVRELGGTPLYTEYPGEGHGINHRVLADTDNELYSWMFSQELAPNSIFIRGDCNDDGNVDVSDAQCILDWLFLGGATPPCIAGTNTNGDEATDISDAVYLLGHLFIGGSPPLAPFPDCGFGFLPTDEDTCDTTASCGQSGQAARFQD